MIKENSITARLRITRTQRNFAMRLSAFLMGLAFVGMVACESVLAQFSSAQPWNASAYGNRSAMHGTMAGDQWVVSPEDPMAARQDCYGSCFPSSAGTCASSSSCGSGCCGTCGLHGSRHHANWKPLCFRDHDYFQLSYEPPCPGTRLNDFLETQKANGRLAQYAFYGFHFTSGDASGQIQLNRAGLQKVEEIARIWQLTPGPIGVAPSAIPGESEMRLAVVVNALTQIGMPVGPEMVSLNGSLPQGISGPEALQIYSQRMMGSTLNPLIMQSGSSTDGSGISTNSGNGSARPTGAR
jgi:hypothetical protein